MNKLEYYRIIQGMQLKDLVLATGYSMGHISHIENGSRQPSREAMDKIAVALGKTVPEVFYTDLSDADKAEMEARKRELKVGGANGL